MQPSSLKEEVPEIQASLGNFGHITYGQTIMGKVIHPDLANKDGCSPIQPDQFTEMIQPAGMPNILQDNLANFILVDRGNCPNPQKVRNIENYGGAVALIADYLAEDEDMIVMNDYGGAGHSLVTPGFMIDVKSGHAIKKATDSGQVVIMRASLTIAKPDNQIEIGLLYSSTMDLESSAMQAFTTLALESAQNRQKALLDLHIHTFGCPTCPQSVKEDACVSDGKYCAFFPKIGDLEQQLLDPEDFEAFPKERLGQGVADFTGKEILESSLYEKCYHNEVKKVIESGGKDTYDLEKQFIERLVQRLTQCEQLIAESGVFKRPCLFSIQQAPVPLQAKIQKCYDESWSSNQENNEILKADAIWTKDHHLDFHPTITINDFTYRGDIDFADIREVICAAYQERPKHCNLEEIWLSERGQTPFAEGEGNEEHKEEHASKFLKRTLVIGIIVFVFIVNCFLWMYMQRKTRRETTDDMNQRVSASIHEYFALSDPNASYEDDF